MDGPAALSSKEVLKNNLPQTSAELSAPDPQHPKRKKE